MTSTIPTASGTTYLTRLVVAVTTADEAEIAVPWARTLAGQLHLPLVFVYVLDPARLAERSETIEMAEAMARDSLQILATDGRLDRLDVTTEVLVGEAASELPRFAQRQAGTVVVLVRDDDATGFAGGRLADAIFPALISPFIVIPPRAAPPSSIRSIVVGSDRSDLAETVLRTSQTFGQSMNMTVIEVEVVEPGTVGQDEFLRTQPTIGPRRVRVRGLASRSLLLTARARDAALIVVGARGDGDSGGAAMGRTADYLTRFADRPVVVVSGVPSSGVAPAN